MGMLDRLAELRARTPEKHQYAIRPYVIGLVSTMLTETQIDELLKDVELLLRNDIERDNGRKSDD